MAVEFYPTPEKCHRNCKTDDPPLVPIQDIYPIHDIRCHHWNQVLKEEMVSIGKVINCNSWDGIKAALLQLNEVTISDFKQRLLNPLFVEKDHPATRLDITIDFRCGETIPL